MRNLEQVYFRWLYSLIGDDRIPYLKLTKLLHEIPFTWTVPNDDNRLEDGRALRERFVEDNNLPEKTKRIQDFIAKEVSVFEVMVALAERLNFMLYKPEVGDQVSKRFMELLRNLHFEELRDDFISGKKSLDETEAQVRGAVKIMISREYDRRGNGSLFPIKRDAGKNMRNTEIWYQMMYWLSENHGL